jgi:hypothetical protein
MAKRAIPMPPSSSGPPSSLGVATARRAGSRRGLLGAATFTGAFAGFFCVRGPDVVSVAGLAGVRWTVRGNGVVSTWITGRVTVSVTGFGADGVEGWDAGGWYESGAGGFDSFADGSGSGDAAVPASTHDAAMKRIPITRHATSVLGRTAAAAAGPSCR